MPARTRSGRCLHWKPVAFLCWCGRMAMFYFYSVLDVSAGSREQIFLGPLAGLPSFSHFLQFVKRRCYNGHCRPLFSLGYTRGTQSNKQDGHRVPKHVRKLPWFIPKRDSYKRMLPAVLLCGYHSVFWKWHTLPSIDPYGWQLEPQQQR